MRTHILHMDKAQNSLGTPAGKSHRTWRAYRPRQLAREGGGSAATRVSRLREYHVLDQHAEGCAGTRSLHRAVPFPPHRDSRVFIVSPKSWVQKVLVNFWSVRGVGSRHPQAEGTGSPEAQGSVSTESMSRQARQACLAAKRRTSIQKLSKRPVNL